MPPMRNAVAWALASIIGLAACDTSTPRPPPVDAAVDAATDTPVAVGMPVAVDVPDPRECDTPDACAWIESYQRDVIGRLAGREEVSPGVTLAHRASVAERTAARVYLRDALAARGLDVSLRAYATGQNVVASLPATAGATAAARIVVGAHYDSVPAGPGAADDGTGVAIVLAAARYLADLPRRDHPVDFVLFDQEEIGLVGSAAYVAALRDQGAAVDSVHCFDMVSFDGDGDGAVELWSPSAGLEDLYRLHGTPRGIPVHAVTFASSDHQSFLRRGFVAVGVGEEFVGGDHTPHYHRATDTFDRIDFAYLGRITRLALDVLADRVVD